MSIFRVNKTKDYTIISNYHFKDKRLSLKAKGLLSEMFSLPEDWDYSIKGLIAINQENETSIKSTLEELKKCGYLVITKKLPNETKSGRFEYVYDIFEVPNCQKQGGGFLPLEFQPLENQVQYNTNNKIYNNNKEINNNKLLFTKKSEESTKKFKKPTIDEVKKYCQERNNGVDPQKFFDYYEVNDWKDQAGKPVKSWKQKMIANWERKSKPVKKSGMDKFNDVLERWMDE